MIRRLLRSLAPALLLALIAGQAWAEVTVTFYAHPGARIRGGDLLFPHAYVHAEGTVAATGEPVDWSAGFTAKSPGPHLLFARGGGVVLHARSIGGYAGSGQGWPDEGEVCCGNALRAFSVRVLACMLAFCRDVFRPVTAARCSARG